MPPLPKPDSQRRNRVPPRIPVVMLPADGRSQDPPPCPLRGDQWWNLVWASPSATQWRDEDVPAVSRLGVLLECFDTTHDPKFLPEIRQLEDRLGLTPKARAQLHWVVADEDGIVLEAKGRPTSAAAERRKSLRVVDGDGAVSGG